MAEALAAGLAVEAAKAVMKTVADRVLEEVALVWGFKDQLKLLQNRFIDIQAFLEDLGSAKYAEKSKFVNVWLNKLTDVAYSADELIDDYEYELLRRKIELKNNPPSLKKKCSNFIRPATSPVAFRIRMSHRVKEILSNLDELDNEAIKNGLQKVQLAREAVASSTTVGYYGDKVWLHENRKHAAARGSEFIGRKSDEETLLRMILRSSGQDVHHLSTVAVVGIGGLGKTTLARKLYEHEKIEGHFDKNKVWICVSEDFKVDRLLNEMFECLTSTKSDLTNTYAITNKLQQKLKGKKFFLVLDDVWENNQDLWNSFINALLSIGDLRGCVILITTRSIDVANKARAFYQHSLKGLSEDEGWVLLKQKVFNETFPYNPCFDSIGRRIVNKCNGVPMAIKAIGGILQSKKHLNEWESMENSELWGFQPEDVNDIMPSLLLSYNHLNHVFVKQCFAYCAIFPKDFKMQKHQLVTLWLAQGFLYDNSATNNSTSTMELVGEKYFDILLNHSFLEEEKDGYYDRIIYKMHDLVHDLASFVLEKELLVWKVGNKRVDVSHVQHLAFVLAKNESPPETFTNKLTTRKLRTVCFWGSVPSWNNLLGSASYIRTLIMADNGLTEVPHIIEKLVHLRYLDLSHNEIDVLPESICKLYQLQTLRIVKCKDLKELPINLHKLKSLRHIEMDIILLGSRRHTNTTHSLLASRRLGELTNLQTFPPLKLRDQEGWTIDELGPLDKLKGLVNISGLEHVKNKETASKAGFGRKDKIVTLHLEWGADREAVNNDEDVLDNLEPHPNLQSFYVNGFMGVSFPSWMMTMVVKHGGHSTPLMNLTDVILKSCSRCLELPSLGQLPFLRNLWLQGFDDLECIGEAFYQSKSNNSSADIDLTVIGSVGKNVLFPSLSELHIISFESLTTWMPPPPWSTRSVIMFPNLEILDIQDCPQLETVPCVRLLSLKHLELINFGDTQPLDIIKYSHALTSLKVEKMVMKIIPQDLSKCTNLEKLSLYDCWNVHRIPSGLVSLKELEIRKCPRLCIPDNLSSLQHLYISESERLKSIPSGLLSLETMEIVYCPNLACIPDNLTSLRKLTLKRCTQLERMPSLEEFTSLEYMLIQNCPMIKGPIPNFSKLQGLTDLNLMNSGELLISSLQGIPNFSHLRELTIGGFRDEWDYNLTFPQCLRYLTMSEFPKIESLPRQFLPCTLEYLKLEKIYHLEQLPEWIGNLSSLDRLCITKCYHMKYLPSKQAMKRLSKLLYLYINDCQHLKERYAKENGPEWPIISHIPYVTIY